MGEVRDCCQLSNSACLQLGPHVCGPSCFLMSSLRLVFHIGFFSIPYSLFTAIISISLSLHLVLLAPVNSCELHNYHLVLSSLFMYSSSGLSTDVFFPNKTNINNKNGLGAIKPRQRPNKSPTNYLYTKPSNQSTDPQSIRRFSRPSTRVQPYVYTMHQNPSHGFARVENVIGANLRNTVNPEKLSLMVMTDKIEYIHHTIQLSNTSLPCNTINKTTNKKA